MTKVLLTIATAFLANAAMAVPLSCNGAGGWSLSVNGPNTLAVLGSSGQEVATLQCQTVSTMTSPSQTHLHCSPQQPVADAGYYFETVLVGISPSRGTLSEQTIAGPRKLADLLCVRVVNEQD